MELGTDSRPGSRSRSSRVLVLGALALGALLLLLAFRLLDPGRTKGELAPSSSVEAGEKESALPASAPDLPPGPVTRSPLPAQAPPTEAPETQALAESARTDELRGRVVDVLGAPIPAARVSIRRGEAREFTVLDLEVSRATELVAESATDASGEFRFTLARGVPVDLRAEAPGLCETVVAERYAGEFVEIVLARGFRVHGRITRERDGTGVAGAQVRVFRLGGPSTLERLTESLDGGHYECLVSFHEGATLEVVPEHEQCSDWIELEFGPDGNAEQDVVLATGITVEGRVTEAGTGRPIEGALVGEGWTYRRTAQSDVLGEYRLEGFGDPGVMELAVRAKGYGQTKKENLPPAVDGVMHVDFELAPARSAVGIVLDPERHPLSGVYVAAVASEFGPEGQRTDWLSSRTGEDGRFRIENLTGDLRHALFVARHGWSTRVYDFPESEPTLREIDLGEIVLKPPALLCGKVVDESGAGLAEVEVLLKGWNADRFSFLAEFHQPLADFYVDSRAMKTDREGRFWFGGVAEGSYRLRARARGRPESPALQVEVGEGELQEGLVLSFATGGAIRGRVVDARGNGIGGAYLAASPERLLDPSAQDQILGRRVSARTDSDGAFEMQGLPEGEYRLDVYPFSIESDPEEPWLPANVEHVRTGTQDLVIELPRGASIRGVLIDAAGAPLSGYEIVPAGPGSEAAWSGSTDVEGRFSIAVPKGTVWTLEVRGAGSQEAWEHVFLRTPGVAAGTRDLVLRLAE